MKTEAIPERLPATDPIMKKTVDTNPLRAYSYSLVHISLSILEQTMESRAHRVRLLALALWTLACLAGAGSLGLLRPQPAYAQYCANGACSGILCRYSPTYGCSFPDRNSCTTRRCAFNEE